MVLTLAKVAPFDPVEMGAFIACCILAFILGCFRPKYGMRVLLLYLPLAIFVGLVRAAMVYVLFGLAAELLIGNRIAKRSRNDRANVPTPAE